MTSMKLALFACLVLLGTPALGDADVRIPENYIKLIKSADTVDVTGTNDRGTTQEFTIHDYKAIAKFVEFLTSDRYTAVAKNLQPDFKSRALYQVRLSSKGATVLEFRVIADTILDLPAEPSYYMQSERYSANIMAPLLRLR